MRGYKKISLFLWIKSYSGTYMFSELFWYHSKPFTFSAIRLEANEYKRRSTSMTSKRYKTHGSRERERERERAVPLFSAF
jgi:hypothetical protein